MTLPAAGLAVLALVVPAGISVAAALGGDHGPVGLEVTVQDWTGWSREQPAPSTRTVRVDEDDHFTVDAVGGDITITVVAISGGEVRVETDANLASGGSLRRPRRQPSAWTAPARWSLQTPTMDGGTTIRLAAR
ncbi:hypothetical protein [Nocardioides convexus]|uniref:hypothetical protein n=1 Tax=Nocardioides convexus TaxID=2712224 RepID=UPI0024185E89|nr:hypothetical protein [Nocardioides convexus]